MKSNLKSIIFFLLLIIGFVFLAVMMTDGLMSSGEELTWSDIVTLFEEDRISEFTLDTSGKFKFKYVTSEGDERSYEYQIGLSQQVDYINDKALELGLEEYDYKVKETSWLVSVIPYILIIGGMLFLYWFMFSRVMGKNGKMNNFAKAKVKLGSSEKNPVLFRDVAGADEEKAELTEIVEFLRDPQKFTRLGARIPRGVLLMGPPGTGKTLLARAVAGEAGVPFYSISGSDFVEMYVGVGASRVRDLFENARKSPASIIFIDEIDAVGRHRGAGLGGGHDEREQTLNQLLVEMDGFGHHDGVIVIAATNRPDILDPALLRPGRFDRQVTVNTPDLKGRVDILKVHSRNRPLGGDVDFDKVAQTTVGFTGADLANLLNEASILAARRNKQLVGMAEIEEATLKIMVGTEKKSMKITEEEKRKTAYHEAGHAILAELLDTQDPVRRISVIPSGRALGYTLNPPVKDKYSVYKNELIEEIAMLLGGRAAEKIIFGDVSGGASNDIQRATQIARTMVMKLGMSDKLGNIRFGSDHGSDEVFLGRDFSSGQDYSPATAAVIDAEIKRFIDEGYALAEKTLIENIDKLHFISEFLVKYETMDDEQFAAAMAGDKTIEDIAALADEKRRKTEEENERARVEEEKRQRELAAERARKERLDEEENRM